MDTQKFKRAAALVCLAYILVQSFQWWVFAQVPPDGDAVKNFLNGSHTLHIWRSTLMLFSMFGLWFIYTIICLETAQYQRAHSILAFVSFSIFCFLEICLRSTELFYIQLSLPEQYQSVADPQSRSMIETIVNVFYQVQSALYFPLGLGWMLGSVIVAATSPKSKVNYVLKATFTINAVRICLRMLTVYGGFNILNDQIYSALYLPLVIITFGLLGYWFLRSYKIDCKENRSQQVPNLA